MALSNLFEWSKKSSFVCGSSCGAGDKPAACGAGDKTDEKPAACGSACGSGDK